MQKRKPGQPHKGWKAAARKSRRKPLDPYRIIDVPRAMERAFPTQAVNETYDHIVKGHSPWNDRDHDAGIPSDANEVLNEPWSAAMTESKPTGSTGDHARSEIVAEMRALRNAPKGPFAPSPYTKESEDASKLRERLTDFCFTILAKAIEKAAATIVAGREVPEPPVESYEPWSPVGPGTPLNTWLETKITRNALADEHNVCMCCIASIGDEPEWVEKSGGRTTVTHHSFAAPTHWRWPVED